MVELTPEMKLRILEERPENYLSEGEQIKASIRTLYETSREGNSYDETNPLKIKIYGVNGSATKFLNLHKGNEGKLILWYSDD